MSYSVFYKMLCGKGRFIKYNLGVSILDMRQIFQFPLHEYVENLGSPHNNWLRIGILPVFIQLF